MSSEIFQLYLLISAKDAASGSLNRIEAQLRGMGKEGKAALQTFQSLRENMQRDLGASAVAVGTLMALRKGVQVAGDYEASMADLRMSIQELGADGHVNAQKLANDFSQLEVVGTRLGNQLPGATADFVQMFSTLKQGGLSAKTIIDGAGESVANLAVVTSEIPKDLAEPFAQYAQQFSLTGDEAIKLSDTLAKIRFATGLRPQELIEGSKFFQLRAGLPLGLTGLQGGETAGRLLATLRSYGLEGGIGGRELGGFMLSLNFNTKEKLKLVKELEQKKGIKLKFFDDKGAFLGVENVFRQMEQFRKLSTSDQMKFGEKLFDREGMAIASVFTKSGVAGWEQINQRIARVPPLQDMINQKMETFNAKVEAVQGTFSNLTATAFTPMLGTLKPMLDTANSVVGSLQEIAKEYPGIAGIATGFVGVTSAAAAVTFTVKAGVSMFGLYRIASGIAMKGVQGDLLATGVAADIATVKAGRLNTMVAGIGRMGALKITVALAAVGATYELLSWLKEQNDNYRAEVERLQNQASSSREEALMRGQLYGPRSKEAELREALRQSQAVTYSFKPGSKERADAEIKTRWAEESLSKAVAARETQERLAMQSWESISAQMYSADIFENLPGFLGGKREKHFGWTGPRHKQMAVEQFRGEQALYDPNVLARLIRQAERGELAGGGVKSGEEIAAFKSVLQEAFGAEKFKQAQDIALIEKMTELSQSTQTVNKDFTDLFRPSELLSSTLNRAADSAGRFSNRLGAMTFTSPTSPSFAPPTWKFGGDKSEPSFTPPTFNFRKSSLVSQGGGSSKSVTFHGGIHVNVPAGSTAANDPEELARLVAHQVEIQMERA